MSDEIAPEDIMISDGARSYLADLRCSWRPDWPRPSNRGLAAGNRYLSFRSMTANPQSDAQPSITRRRAMQGAVAAVTLAALGGSASAAEHGLDHTSEYHPAPSIETTVTIGEHNSDMTSLLQFVDDSDEIANLADWGAVVDPRPETPDDQDPDPHNPVSVRADLIDAQEFRAFPRGEQFDESGDGDAETDVSAIDATHWTIDDSGSAGTLTVEDGTTGAGDNSLEVSISQGAGDSAIATFEPDEAVDGALRQFIQAVLNVNSRDTDTVVEVVVYDGTASRSVEIATETGNGQVVQQEIGELSGDDLDQIDTVELSISEGSADLSIVGLNVERSSAWDLGESEYWDSNDEEIKTETVTEPSGRFTVRSAFLDDLDDALSGATIKDLQVDSEFVVAELGKEMIDFEIVDGQDYGYENRLRMLVNFEPPTAYDLTYSGVTLADEIRYPGDRHITTEYATGLSNAVYFSADDEDDQDQYEDVEGQFVDETSTYNGGEVDDSLELSTGLSAGNVAVVHYDVGIPQTWVDELEDTSGMAGGPTGSSSSSLLDRLLSPIGAVLSAAGLTALVQAARGRLPVGGE